MDKNKIWLSAPHMGGNELKYIHEAFDANWITSIGANLDYFEADLEKYLDNEGYVTLLNSGTAAIHLGLILLGVKAADEVICQSMTFSASANPIMYLGATAVFVDSEAETWNLCPLVLEEAIVDRIAKGKKPKAIIAVHLCGMPYNVDAIHAVADKYQIPVLEDSAGALGSHYKKQKCGTFGTIGIFSFNGNKMITTSAGGAFVSQNKRFKDKAIFLATQARKNAPHYQHSEVGYNYRMSNICAGIGRGQMEVLDQNIQLRREMNRFYSNYFEDIVGVTVLTEPNDNYFSNHWLSAITIDTEKTAGKTAEQLRLALEQANIESRPLWKPMHQQPVFEKYPYYGGTIAEHLFETGLCLPSGSNLTAADRERIKEALDVYFR